MKTIDDKKVEENFKTLHEIYCTVEIDRYRETHNKYKIKETESNYIVQIKLSDEEWKEGYRSGYCSQRIKKSRLLKPEKSILYDSPKSIRRSILYFKEDEETALNILRKEIEDTINTYHSNILLVKKSWEERKTA